VRKEERQAILGQDVVRPETPRERRQRAGLEQDLATSPLLGQPLALRLRNFRPNAEGYLASLGGPLPYMVRLREIDALTAAHAVALEAARRELAIEERDAARFAERWTATVRRWSFDEVNDLIERHNRWYPVESRLAMDPVTGDYALVNGADYRRRPLDAAWALERFPALRPAAARGVSGDRGNGRGEAEASPHVDLGRGDLDRGQASA
jgi:hypothetical protein